MLRGCQLHLTPAGLIAQGSVAGFDVGPFHWEDSFVDLKLTLLEQYLKMRGGASLDLPNGDSVGGRMTLDMRPLEIKFYGHLENIFGFDATVNGSSSIDFAQLFYGEPPADMNLHVVLASKAFDVGPGPDGVHHDFVAELEGQVDQVLGQLQDALQDISDFVSDVIQDPVGALSDLVQNLQELGVTSGLPTWMTDIVADIADWADLASDAGDSLSINDILNGPKIDGVEGFYFPEHTTCVQTVLGVPLLTIEVDPDTLEVTVELTEGTVDDDGNCWTIEPAAWNLGIGVEGEFVEPECVGIEDSGECWLLPPVEFPELGLCDTLDLESCDLGALIGEEFMPLMSQVLDDTIASFGDVAGADVAGLITALNQAFEGDPLFQLRCAEFDLSLGDFNETELGLGLELILGGQAHGAGVTWNFDNFDGSVESLIGVLFAEFEAFTCSTLPDYVTEDSSVTGNIAGEPGAPPAAPPANLTITRTPGTVDEGSSVTVNGTFDRPLGTSGVVTIDWGDETQTTVPVGAGATTLPAQTHLYLDDDPNGTKKDLYTISASIDTGGIGDSVSVWVRNVSPVITELTVTPDTIDEGASVQLGLTFTDVGVEDTHAVLVTWGDGSAPQSFAPSDPMVHTYLDDNPTVTTQDPYVITVKVTDDDTVPTTWVLEVDVRNVAPSNVDMTWTTDPVNEGALVTFQVTFTDPGLGDTHRVEIDWDGDENGFVVGATRSVPPGNRTLTVSHRFRDDHPDTGTPDDVLTPAVRVVDDDSGTSEAVDEPITVYNIEPAIVEANVVTTPSSVDENHDVVLTGAFTDPGIPDSHTVTIDWGDESADTVLNLRVGRRDFDATHRYLDDHPLINTAQDDFTVTMTVTDDDTGTDSATKVVTVHNVDPALTVDTADATGPTYNTSYNTSTGILSISVQYSDPIGGNTPFTVTATDVVGDPLTIAVESNGTTGSAAFAALLAGTLDECAVDTVDSNIHHCTFAVGSVPNPATGIYTDIAPGTYSVNVVVRDNDLGTTIISVSVTVLPEDARVWYHGAYFAATAPSGTSVPVELRSTVRDITGVPDDEAYDPWPGDIRQATVRWVDRDPAPETPLCPAPVDRPVDAVFADFNVFNLATSVGVASCTWSAFLGTANARTYTVGTVVNRYYTRNEGTDDIAVTIVRPLNESITGGGYVVPTQSTGTYASTPGTHANFGFNVKFNKKNTNLQGSVNLIVRSEWRGCTRSSRTRFRRWASLSARQRDRGRHSSSRKPTSPTSPIRTTRS